MSFRSSIRTVEVQGAITTVTTAPPVAPSITQRGVDSRASQGQYSLNFVVPAAVVAGDLLVITAWSYPSTSALAAPSGWTLATAYTSAENGRWTAFTRVAQAGDAGTTVTVTLPEAGGSGTLTAWAGATKFTMAEWNNGVGSGGTVALSSGAGTVTGNVIVVNAGSGTNPFNNPTVTWAAPGSGGPPATQPSWSVYSAPDGAVPSRSIWATANWSPAAAYTVQVKNNGPGQAAVATYVIS